MKTVLLYIVAAAFGYSLGTFLMMCLLWLRGK